MKNKIDTWVGEIHRVLGSESYVAPHVAAQLMAEMNRMAAKRLYRLIWDISEDVLAPQDIREHAKKQLDTLPQL